MWILNVNIVECRIKKTSQQEPQSLNYEKCRYQAVAAVWHLLSEINNNSKSR